MINNSNNLLAALDAAYGFPNKTSSTFYKVKQTYDDNEGEHVIWIAYVVTVKPGQQLTESKVKREPGALYRAVTQG